ncbi:aminoglycoside phosphotransferase family protein [Actinoplanes utahensis]|uniref:Aminoglycoside phosphotransferase n=1 Tax=Actinoplanes utahensis TaxID=1869 RepID=A0A0A6UHD6_ACTUT|nr:aminoglycoside phosphotransferase family protein [Actinoplanes utahensis]KHD74831.1 aminoglycoside phosphotransferase [Actinoplanes utahensis]GIF30809.1 hypothetical protein Aut01nite_37950 [Actinoplanes utahensis]
MTGGLGKLTSHQRDLLDGWLPGLRVERDHSWGVVETTVLEVTHGGERFIVKAGGAADHHIAREINAHRHWLTPWTSRGRAPRMRHGDDRAKILVCTYLPGDLVLDTEDQRKPETFRQAGELLALLHAQPAGTDGYERRENEKSLKALDGPHRIAAPTVERLRKLIRSWPEPQTPVVPAHGDWQPRNWLIHDGVVSVIDFGRAALRPAYTDFGRLEVQDFRDDPGLAKAFIEGYGSDPRESAAWRRNLLREGIGTASWAYAHGLDDFEAQGHRMIAEALG